MTACWCWCRIATLREAFRNTPTWLGFNIELKYPTEVQLAAMPTRFYSRNYFCDSILKVIPVLLPSARPIPSMQCFMGLAVKTEDSSMAVAIDRRWWQMFFLQVVLEEAGTRKVIFSTFDPDCATLLSLKQPRFPGALRPARFEAPASHAAESPKRP